MCLSRQARTSNAKQTDMTLSEQHKKLESRQKTCGGFMYRLIDAWYHADGNNKLILERAFKDTAFDLT